MTMYPPRMPKSPRRIAKLKGTSTIVAYCLLETKLRKAVEDWFEVCHPCASHEVWKRRVELPRFGKPITLGDELRALAEISDRIDYTTELHIGLEDDAAGTPDTDPFKLFPFLRKGV